MGSSTFQPKHYNELALLFQQASSEQANTRRTIEIFCEALTADNPNFKRDRFVAACVPGAPIQEDAAAKRARELRVRQASTTRRATNLP